MSMRGLLFERLSTPVADVQQVHDIVLYGEEYPVNMRSLPIKQLANFKWKQNILRSSRATFRKFSERFDG
jgi:hypothetical protein